MRVAIIGAGYAGLACAVALADGGIPVAVFEAGRIVGGRARRVTVQHLGLDNGAHLMIGAYRALRGLMRRVGMDEKRAFLPVPLTVEIAGEIRLSAPRVPAPLNVAAALLSAQGLSWSEKFAAIQFQRALAKAGFSTGPNETTQDLLLRHRQGRRLREMLWNPLCTAALNTPPECASAQVFANVLRDTFHRSSGDSEFLLPRLDLSALFPDPAVTFIRKCGGEVRLGHRVRSLEIGTDRVTVDGEAFSRVVVATSPWHAGPLVAGIPALSGLADRLIRVPAQPITTVYLQYPASVRLDVPMLGLGPNAAPWVFDRGHTHNTAGLMGVVFSAWKPPVTVRHDALAGQTDSLLRERVVPGLPRPLWHRVIVEKRATYSCDAALDRPGTTFAHDLLLLAGDYADAEYPATLEAATRSGLECARRIRTCS